MTCSSIPTAPPKMMTMKEERGCRKRDADDINTNQSDILRTLSSALSPCVNTDINYNVTVTMSISFTTMPMITTTMNQHQSSPTITNEDWSMVPTPNIFFMEWRGSRRGAKFHVSSPSGCGDAIHSRHRYRIISPSVQTDS